MNRSRITLLYLPLMVLLIIAFPVAGQAVESGAQKGKINYYRIDKVQTLRGEITAVKTEKCYKQNDYTVIYLKEKKTGDSYRVEVAPQWFFAMDLVKGCRVEITGSVSKTADVKQVMTRSIMFQGEKVHFRDKHGFPLWRGKKRKGNRKFPGKRRGERRKRGNF